MFEEKKDLEEAISKSKNLMRKNDIEVLKCLVCKEEDEEDHPIYDIHSEKDDLHKCCQPCLLD
jgi:hypothetical protein